MFGQSGAVSGRGVASEEVGAYLKEYNQLRV